MNNNELMHHGVLGMKWGVRRYQNPDGTLTAAGKKRQQKMESGKISSKKLTKEVIKANKAGSNKNRNAAYKKLDKDIMATKEYKTIDKIVKEANNVGARYIGGPKVENAMKKVGKKYYEVFLKNHSNIASATLKDLGYLDTKKAREHVRKLLDDDLSKMYLKDPNSILGI